MSPSSGNDSEKPRMSYAQLIAEGLVNAPDGMLTLSKIYNRYQRTASILQNGGPKLAKLYTTQFDAQQELYQSAKNVVK